MLSNKKIELFCLKITAPLFRLLGSPKEESKNILNSDKGSLEYNIDLSKLSALVGLMVTTLAFIPLMAFYAVLSIADMRFLGNLVLWGILTSFCSLSVIAGIKGTLLQVSKNSYKNLNKFNRYTHCMNDIDLLISFIIGCSIGIIVGFNVM